MADVTITNEGTGTCQYCEEQPATKLVNGEWNACEGCAARVEMGTRDVGYEVYCAVTALKSSGHTWCNTCERPIEECACIDEQFATLDPDWPKRRAEMEKADVDRLRKAMEHPEAAVSWAPTATPKHVLVQVAADGQATTVLIRRDLLPELGIHLLFDNEGSVATNG